MGIYDRAKPSISHAIWRGGPVLAGVTVLSMLCFGSSAVAAPARTAATGPVSAVPAAGTPELATTSVTEKVRQLVRCGKIMYAVGAFTEISQGGTTFPRNNIFSFKAAAPYTVTPWNPDVNGLVNSITFNGGNCAKAYIGGSFTSVHGTAVRNIAEISTSTGAVNTNFAHDARGGVDTLLGVDGHILAGGAFTLINGSTSDPFMTSLSPATGKNDRFLRLHISGHIQFHNVRTNSTYIYNQQLSHSGKLDLVEGDFTKVARQNRQQIFMLNLTTNPATVTGWSSPEFDGSKGNVPGGYPYQCNANHPVYIQTAGWSPDDSTIYIAATGYHPWNLATGTFPRSGLCDAISAFPATQSEVLHYWINYTGCNSLYSVAADNSAVYVGGHERWANNSKGCKFAGTGAIPAPGMGAFTPGPSGGTLLMNKAGTAGLYSRARGHGADDMLLTSAGLWIASDNFDGSVTCGNASGHAGICLLPYK
jgi:hypothetical protein